MSVDRPDDDDSNPATGDAGAHRVADDPQATDGRAFHVTPDTPAHPTETYYAMFNEFSSRERPGGVLRRIEHDNGQHDEAFTRDLKWERTPLLYSYDRGNGDNEFYEISEDEANQIMERIRRTVTGEE